MSKVVSPIIAVIWGSAPACAIAAWSIAGSGLEGCRSAVCNVTKRSVRPWIASTCARPRSDLPVATPNVQPSAASTSSAATSPSYSGSASSSPSSRIRRKIVLYASVSARCTAGSRSGASSAIASTRLSPTIARIATRGGAASPSAAKACSMARQILAWLSTSVPSQSKTASRMDMKRLLVGEAWEASGEARVNDFVTDRRYG
ncbi:exported hypothetical protein [Sphingomonas sp. 8AM]|nr:exported hypothetical protein [Sphingomonas sp. 8AM]